MFYLKYGSEKMIFKRLRHYQNKQLIHKGFTLAEILLTLFIVGVLAAVLIPTITQLAPNNNKAMFKKAYNVIGKAVENMINDESSYPSSAVGTTSDGTNVAVPSGFYVATASSKFCNVLSDNLNTVGAVSCTDPKKGTFSTSDGILWTIYSTTFPLSATSYTTKILLDVNGVKGPNCTQDTMGDTDAVVGSTNHLTFRTAANGCISPDRFIIGVRYDGKLQVGCSTNPCDGSANTDQNAINILSDPTNLR